MASLIRGCAAVMLALGGLGASPAWAATRIPEGGCAGLQAEQEPNDTAANATPIDLSSLNRFSGIHGTTGAPGDVDWYSFTALAGARLWLSVDTGVPSAGTRDSAVSIFAADGVTLIEDDDDDGTGNGRDDTIESLDASLVAGRVLPAAGTYYARVQAKVPGTIIDGYSLLIAFTTASGVPEVEPNDDPTQAQQAPEAVPVIGSLSSAADTDWYKIGVLDNGFPFIAVDGDPERDGIGTDITLRYGNFPPSPPFLVTDSSGNGTGSNPPAEAFAWQTFPSEGWVSITGTGPGTYSLAWWQSGDLCPVPVTLQGFEVE